MLSVQTLIGKGYNDAWFTNCSARYRVFEGARSTKKSVVIGGYEPIFKILTDGNRNVMMCRKDDTNNSSSTYPNIVSLINKMGMQQYFKCKTNPQEIVYKPTGQKIVFKGCNNPEAITSTKFVVGEFTDVYFEEASELESYEAFRKIDGSLRNQSGQGIQITFMLNGWDKKSWIYDVFFKGRLEDDFDYLETHDYMDYYDPDFSIGADSKGLYLHKSTYKINEFRSPYKDESAAHLKEIALQIYCVECLGMWGNTSAQTYMYWNDKLVKTHQELMQMYKYGAFTIGIDIGMGNGEGKPSKNTKDQPDRVRSAMTMELFGLTQDYGKMIALNEWFYTNENKVVKKGSPEVAADMIQQIKDWITLYSSNPVILKGTIVCYVDSADSGGFRTLLEAKAQEMGLMNIVFVASTKNRIQTRVDFTNLMMADSCLLVCDKCTNLIREFGNARQAEDGRCREDIDDHCINAWEYSWIPLLPMIRQWKDFKEH